VWRAPNPYKGNGHFFWKGKKNPFIFAKIFNSRVQLIYAIASLKEKGFMWEGRNHFFKTQIIER